MKHRLNKFFSILLVLCMLLSMMPATAVFAATPSKVYLQPNSGWVSDGARFAAYFFGATEKWVSMTDTNGDGCYEATVPSGNTHVIFCRMNPANTTNSWNNVWNQTTDLALLSDGSNCFVLNEGDWNGGGYWGTYSTDFYLFGYINGANHACEEKSSELGSYKFSGGKLTVTFTQESYVGVKSGDNNRWFMTQGFQGTAKSVTLHNTNKIANAEKLYVPAGIKVTFTLKENSDGTLSLSYTTTASSCQHLVFTGSTCNACGATCSHTWSGSTCTKCGTTCSHKWSNGKCSTCGVSCSHKWNGSKCTVCSKTCSHSWSSGKCKTCGSTCTHIKWNGSKCATCGVTCNHSWANGVCKNCNTACSHNYSGGKCTTCGFGCNHSYMGGTCTGCGATRDFYLFGYINGANHACEGDAANLGSYKFSGGKLTVTFTEDSYVAVKTSDNAGWYMANAYTTEKSVTLYNTTTGSNEKLFVPGGAKVTFTLTDNGNDTLKLSYTVASGSCQHLSHDGNGKCSACGTNVGHNWINSYCSGCGTVCSHSYTSKVTTAATCTTAGVKTYTCSTCSNSYTETIAASGHKISGTKCTVCGYSTACSHSYTSTITTAATCVSTGVKTFSCSKCGDKYTESIPVTNHSYSGGKCSVCGVSDPAYNTDYYLFGYINDANYGCEEDHQTLGQYKFVGGKLTVRFQSDSYVGVKTGDNSNWYMTQGWQGTDVTSVTMYNTSINSNPDKMFVPGGVEVTFTLSVNSEDSLTLSYVVKTCSHSYSSKITTAATCTTNGVKTYTCSLCGNAYTETIAATGHKYSGGSCTACGAADPSTSSSATLVTSASSLKVGDKIIIVARNYDFALSTTQNTSNRGQVAVTKSGNTVIYSAAAQVITLESGSSSGTFAFNVGGKYLYAASSYGNYLKSTTSLSANASWSISINSSTGAATVVAAGSSSRNTLRYNSGSGLFSCYADSSTQDDIRIYKVSGSVGCTHNYMIAGTVNPTCTANGQKTYRCDACGDTYTETIAATGHSYSGSSCTVCGAADPNYNATYYLFGFINGMNYACEDDYSNPGIFKFVNGKLTATFETDSYVGVKTGDNANWYMTNGWQGIDATSVVLYDTSMCANPDKMYVPGGVKLTFTLVKNADGTLTLSYTASSGSCNHLSHNASGNCIACGQAVGHTWVGGYCSGCGSTCAHSYSSKITTAATCNTNGVKTLTCTKCGNVTTETIIATGHSYSNGKCTVCGESDGSSVSKDYYLFGWINGGNYACEENWEELGAYKFVNGKLTVTFNQDSYIGIKDGDNRNWYMTQFFESGTTATFYNTNIGVYEKMLIPGGVKLTFTLKENANDTLTLSYTVDSGSCSHLSHGTDGKCSACGTAVNHSWNKGYCTVCGLECIHSWTSKITTAATCDTNGVKTYTCSKCSHSYTEPVAATGHNFSGNTCTVCGTSKPTATREFYLFGYINGKNYGCEEDSANIGSYKFENGKLTVTFNLDSYVGIKTGDNSTWYMTDGWRGVVTTAVMYNTTTLFNADKLFIPGGVQVTLTLTETANDTLTLSYTVDSGSCQHMGHDANGNCNACGVFVGHSFVDGKCSVCNKACAHNYSSKITAAPSCDTNGVQTHSCTVCGYSYTETLAATGHSYVNGTCTVCGDTNSSTVTKDYYLFGWINGGNYACEENGNDLGAYKFVGGKLTATFDVDSYIGVKAGDNLHWYMTRNFVTDTTATFYNTNTGVYEKMFVPGGVKVTFTLTENADDTLTLHYTTEACSHSYTSKVTLPATNTTDGIRTYTCSKCGDSYTEVIPATDRGDSGSACTHSYTEKVTTAATCTNPGVKTFTCSKCGNSYTESIAALGHSYSNGACTTCGKTQGSSVKLRFVDSVVWQNVCVYLWKVNSKGTTTNLNTWPGEILNRDGEGYFSLDLDYTPTSGESLGMIFHNFNGGQTTDVVIDYATLKNGEVWIKPNTWTNGDGKNECYVTTNENSMYLSPEINGSVVTFRYQNSSAKSVAVAGSFNGWSTTANKMTKGSDGWWTTTVTLNEGVYEYRFVVGGSEWILDPNNGLIGGYDGNNLAIVGGEGSKTSDTITVKFHFYRENGDYTDWDVWFWCNGDGGSSRTLVDDPLYKGKTATYTLSGKNNANVKYKVRKTDWSDEEFWERSIDLSNIASGTVHFFVQSGSFGGSTVYGNDVIKMAKPTYANLDYNSGNIWVKTPLPVTGSPSTAFSLVKSDGSASGISVTGVTMDNNGYSLQLSRKPALIEVNDLRVKYNTLQGVSTDGLFYSYGFANDYSYWGNDLGATWSKNSTTFKVWAPTATGVSVILYGGGNWGGDDWISTTAMTLGSQGVWSVTIKGNLHGKYYNFLVNFPGYSCEATDPYAKSVGVNGDRGQILDMSTTDPEGWDEDVSPNKNMSYTDAIIYEMHLREMTIDASSGVKEEWRGKYLGMTQTGTNYQGRGTALQHLKELGVTHVQIMPMYDFAAVDEYHLEDWCQYGWGYDPKNFNAPEGSYSTDPYHGEVRINEVKQMVQTFHNNGINVIMDVVYNHTFSGGDFCYNKIVPNYFSRFWGENNWSNGSGCGNDLATERSMARNFIVDSILYWVEEYHIDGFRFDLAGLIDSQTINEITWEVHQKYPNVIFYGEGWTGGGGTAVQDGHTLASKENAWSVGEFGFYNDKYRNDIAGDDGKGTGFVSGAGGKGDDIANYFRASNGWSTSPSQTINYVSCHDNYTLIDKIILSRNGAYWDQMVRMNNMAAAMVMLSQGVSFMYSGEELLREKVDQWGNRQHNCYNADDYTTKIRWNHLVDKSLVQTTDDYYSGLINFRKNHSILRCADGGTAWGHTSYYKINDKCIMFYLSGGANYECSEGIIIIFNANEYGQGVNIYDYGVPYGNWQACIHGMQAGVNPLWSTWDGNIIVDSISTTVLVKGDLIHEESVYNQQSYRCSCAYHNQSGLCWDCGKSVGHTFVNGYCSHCNLAQSASGNTTLYYNNVGTNWDNVYCYAWTTVGGLTRSYSGDWPGTLMTDMGNGVFSVSIPNAASHVIFTDNATAQSAEQGLIKNSNGVLTSNLYSSSSGTWSTYAAGSCTHTNHTQSGVCSNCGLDVAHTYSNGVCKYCGVKESAGSLTSYDYYLYGWINGENYAADDTLGIYKFSTGSLTTTFSSDSYVAVKKVHPSTGKVVGWYMTNGWQGENTTVQLYDTANNANPDKLYVPGGMEVAFTLVVNGDGSLTLSYASAECAHTYKSTETVKATISSEGVMTHTCTQCGDSYTEVIPATGRFMTDPNCEHNYTAEVIVQATCIETGVSVYTCHNCDLSYADTVDRTGHRFRSGVCTVCGVEENSDVYYLFGYINGANYGCEEDWQNLGHYQFLGDGTCTATFSADSYLGVKKVNSVTGEVLDWYMTDGWLGFETNTATLYDTEILGGNADKLYVPGGTRLVVRLTVNPNGTLKLTYGDVNCNHTFDNGMIIRSAGCDTEGIKTFSCTKCGHSYNETIPPVGHTCFNGECCICDEVYDLNYLSGCCDKYNHIYTLESETPATCTEYGSRTYVAACGASYSEMIEPTGHSNNSRVTVAATCVLPGQKTYTCSCGYSYTETTEALGHRYHNGVCTVCGTTQSGSEADPDSFYLFGYINGANYGCQEDVETLGEYKFVSGKLVATFATDSYVAVKSGDNVNWYMTDGWQGETKSVVLYNTANLANADKLYVPGGVELTFTLSSNPDGTLTLSYTTSGASSNVTKPTITLKYPTMSFKDEVKLNVYYEATNMDDVVNMGLIVFSSQVNSYTVYNAESVVPGYNYSNSAGLYFVTTKGIPAKNMGDTIWFAVYAQLSDGSYSYGKLVSYSPRDYAYALLGSGDAKLDALLVAMLNYGAAAQNYFGYNTSALLNNQVTAEQKALVSAYSSTMMPNIAAPSAAKQGSFKANGGFDDMYPSVTFGGAFAINYYCVPKYVPSGNVTMYYWREADYNAASVLTAANATGVVTMTGNGTYRGSVSGISAKDISDGVYVAFVYSDGSTTYCSGILPYSIGMYCNALASDTNGFASFAQATAVYGYYAKQYFG